MVSPTRRVRGTEVIQKIYADSLRAGISSGGDITLIQLISGAINPTSVPANSVADQNFTVSGLTTSDIVVVNPPSGLGVGVAGARVTAADTLTVTFTNPTASAVDPASGTWNVVAIRIS